MEERLSTLKGQPSLCSYYHISSLQKGCNEVLPVKQHGDAQSCLAELLTIYFKNLECANGILKNNFQKYSGDFVWNICESLIHLVYIQRYLKDFLRKLQKSVVNFFKHTSRNSSSDFCIALEISQGIYSGISQRFVIYSF